MLKNIYSIYVDLVKRNGIEIFDNTENEDYIINESNIEYLVDKIIPPLILIPLAMKIRKKIQISILKEIIMMEKQWLYF